MRERPLALPTSRLAGTMGLTPERAEESLSEWAAERPDVLERVGRFHWRLTPAFAASWFGVECESDEGIRRCACGCGGRFPDSRPPNAKYRDKACKQRAYRLRRGRRERTEWCRHCGGSMSGKRVDADYCSAACKQNDYLRRRKAA